MPNKACLPAQTLRLRSYPFFPSRRESYKSIVPTPTSNEITDHARWRFYPCSHVDHLKCPPEVQQVQLPPRRTCLESGLQNGERINEKPRNRGSSFSRIERYFHKRSIFKRFNASPQTLEQELRLVVEACQCSWNLDGDWRNFPTQASELGRFNRSRSLDRSMACG
jgi:hypothetical protein